MASFEAVLSNTTCHTNYYKYDKFKLPFRVKAQHPEQFSECCSVKQGSTKAAAASRDEDQPAITECFECKMPYKYGSKWYETCENALADLFAEIFNLLTLWRVQAS